VVHQPMLCQHCDSALANPCARCRPPTIAPTASIRWPTTVAWALAIAPTTAPTRSDASTSLISPARRPRRCSWPSIRGHGSSARRDGKVHLLRAAHRNAEQVAEPRTALTTKTWCRRAPQPVQPAPSCSGRQQPGSGVARLSRHNRVSMCWKNWAPNQPSPTWPPEESIGRG